MKKTSFSTEVGDDISKFDDDGRIKRTGTTLTASAHIITAVIGSGVLSLAWTIAQLGWIAGPIALSAFSLITWFTSILMADCYRSFDGKRNPTYRAAVQSYLGGYKILLCGIAQYSAIVGVSIGYSITTSISMVAVKRSNCFHKEGHKSGCHVPNNAYIIANGLIQIVLSQIPNFHKLSLLSIVAAVMSFAYSSIGLSLSMAKIADMPLGTNVQWQFFTILFNIEGGHPKTSLTGVPIGENMSSMEKMWNTFSALGNIAFAYAFPQVLVEIQDTLKSGIPENVAMKRATLIGISISTIFYMLCGILGYAAFGNNAPGNFLTGFGFYEPFWLIDIANLCIVIHLIGAYQVYSQPLFGFVETWAKTKWENSEFITKEYPIGDTFNLNLFRLVWRTTYVITTTVVAMLFPFFNDFVGLVGAITFWPLTVYLPIEMYISRTKIRRGSSTWVWMQFLSCICLIISLLAAAGSINGLIKSLASYKPFHSVS